MNAARLAALACVLVSLTAGSAAGAEPTIEVHSLKFEGVHHVDADALRAALATRVSSRWPWGKKAAFDRRKFQDDLERIRAFYVDRGFPDARVTSFDVHLNDKSTRVDLKITIEEGEPLRVASIGFSNTEDLPPARIDALRRNLPLKVGQPMDRALAAVARESVVNELREQGYPFARVGVHTRPGADQHAADVTFEVNPGLKTFFGRTEVNGNREVSDNLIRRELLYKEGDLYRRSVVQETQRKLYELELFQFVTLRPDRGERAGSSTARSANQEREGPIPVQFPDPVAPTATRPRLDRPDDPVPGEPYRVPMRLTVTEGKHRRVQFSLGYGTEEKGRVEGQYRRLNLFGGARNGGVQAKWSSLERGLRLDFVNPFFFHRRLSLELNGERWYNIEPAFSSVTSGGHGTVTYRPGATTSYSVTFSDVFQHNEISNTALQDLQLRDELISLGLDPTTGVQDGTLNAVAFDARRTTTANPLDPAKGYSVALHLERAGRWIRGSFAYSNVSLDARYYQPVGRRLVIGIRARGGSIEPTDGLRSSVPFAQRYFLGGAASLRGWGRYELSPLSGSGLPIGGFSMFEGALEARMTLTRSIGAVAFVDFGNVWTESWRVRLNDLRYAVGPGLRYKTPVGPLRVDLGYQVNPVPGLLVDGKPQSRRWRVHFSIGQAF